MMKPLWVVDRMESNATVFEGLLRSVQPLQAKWKPAADKWSLLEVINHVADEENEDFGTRLRLVLEKPAAEWPPIDPPRAAIERQYNGRDMGESLDRFLSARRQSVAWLRGLREPNWESAHTHPTVGILRAGDLLHSWLVHDLI